MMTDGELPWQRMRLFMSCRSCHCSFMSTTLQPTNQPPLWGSLSMIVCHQVRAFAGWPGTTAGFALSSKDGSQAAAESIKILKTRLLSGEGEGSGSARDGGLPRVEVRGKGLVVLCGSEGEGKGCLEILELQPVGKKAMPASAFLNGLSGRSIQLAEV